MSRIYIERKEPLTGEWREMVVAIAKKASLSLCLPIETELIERHYLVDCVTNEKSTQIMMSHVVRHPKFGRLTALAYVDDDEGMGCVSDILVNNLVEQTGELELRAEEAVKKEAS